MPKKLIKYEGIGIHENSNCLSEDAVTVVSGVNVGEAIGAAVVIWSCVGVQVIFSVTSAVAVTIGEGLMVGDKVDVLVVTRVELKVVIFEIGVFWIVFVTLCSMVGEGISVHIGIVAKNDAVTFGDVLIGAVALLEGAKVTSLELCKVGTEKFGYVDGCKKPTVAVTVGDVLEIIVGVQLQKVKIKQKISVKVVNLVAFILFFLNVISC